MRLAALVLLAFAVTGCAKPAAAPTDPATDTATDPAFAAVDNRDVIVPDDEGGGDAVADKAPDPVGRWTGVEGTYLDIARSGDGGYRLTMQWDLDHKGVFAGRAQGDDIVFDRAGRREMLKPSTGAATGVKYLVGKTDCLTVKPGEGYCRT